MSNHRFELSQDADQDILEIGRYTIEEFGIGQSQKYRNGIIETLQLLADNPHIGRRAVEYGRDYRRYTYKSHVIFYRPIDAGIFIVRILGGRVDIPRQFDKR